MTDMRNKLDVLCIDGTTGVGKTTQAIMFHNFLNSLGIKHKVFSLKEVDDIQYTTDQLVSITDYLNKNPDGIAICDGSIASDIVDDMVRNMLKEDIWTRHENNLQIYESLNNTFNIVNVLLTPKDVSMCYDRIKKRTEIYNDEEVEVENEEHLRRTASSLEIFDNNMLTNNIKFHNIKVSRSDSMLDIHQAIKNIIKESHQIKKPS